MAVLVSSEANRTNPSGMCVHRYENVCDGARLSVYRTKQGFFGLLTFNGIFSDSVYHVPGENLETAFQESGKVEDYFTSQAPILIEWSSNSVFPWVSKVPKVIFSRNDPFQVQVKTSSGGPIYDIEVYPSQRVHEIKHELLKRKIQATQLYQDTNLLTDFALIRETRLRSNSVLLAYYTFSGLSNATCEKCKQLCKEYFR